MSTDEGSSGFATGFFKSLTNPFKSHSISNNEDRDKIDSSRISNDINKQQLFNQVRSGSSSSRAKAAEEISQWLYEFNVSSIPDIWYCAKDLVDPSQSQSTRKSAFKLLSACIDIDSTNSEHTVSYFNDALASFQSTKDKVDPQFDIILQIVKKLTDNGSFIHHYQIAFKQPTIDFLLDALSASDINKHSHVETLLMFIVDTIQSGLLSESSINSGFEDDTLSLERKRKENIESMLTLVFKLSLKTSDKLILEQCIKTLDTMIQYHNIPTSLQYKTVEIICGSIILDMHFYDMGCHTIMNLINKSDFKTIFETLISVILCKESKPSDRNINAAVGATKALNHLFGNFSYQFDIELLILTFQEVAAWNKSSLSTAILQFFNETLLQNLSLIQINLDSEKTSIIKVLEVISKHISTTDETELFKLILTQLQYLAESSRYPGSLTNLTMFYIENSKYLSTKNCIFVLRFFVAENLCSPLDQNWMKNLDLLLTTFYHDSSKDVSVRLATLKILSDLLENLTKEEEEPTPEKYDTMFKIADLLFGKLQSETNHAVTEEIFNHYKEISISCSDEVFQMLLNKYIKPGFIISASSSIPSIFVSSPEGRRRSSAINFFANSQGTTAEKQDPVPTAISFPPKTLSIISKGFVNLFTNLFSKGGPKSTVIYDLLIQIAYYGFTKKNTDILLITSRFFVRLRSSVDNQVYLTTPIDIEGLSAAFGRNLLLRKSKESSQTPVQQGTLDEKWTYPEEIDYIPNDCLDKPSLKLTYLQNSNDLKLGGGAGEVLTYSINIEKWLLLLIQILETAPDWEIYSFIYSHFCPQLSNIRLFQSNCGELIRKFRSLICDQLMLKLPSGLKIPSKISKHDLQVAIVRNFTPLISYHGIFSKADEDQIINALVFGLTSWEKTAVPCIHILTVCCYELPQSIKKYLPLILTKLQTRISSAFASAHILEFLLTLSYIPNLTSSFTVEEFKRAFGITFKLIQYAHDIRQMKSGPAAAGKSHQGILNHGEELSADFLPSTEISEITPVIPTYILTLSYDVIANWFLNMRLSDRRQVSSFIMKNLILSQSNRGTEINDQNMSFLDLISRFTYSDLELKFNSTVTPMRFKPDDPVLSSKWIFGNSLISIDTHADTGESVVTIRRASGSTVFKVTPDESMIPLYTNQLHSPSNDDDLFTANYVLLQLIVHPDLNVENKPIAIPDDEPSFNRTIANFDRIPVVEFHKIGLLYIGPGQTTENEILSNTKGSSEYDDFLDKFGRVIELKGCKTFYTGGLDTENNADGDIAYGWNDKILQLIFHTTTLMPNLEETDPNFSNKKRHIGNNYVNIFCDESGQQQFDFNVIKSQFNFLNIVIQPHSISFNDKSTVSQEDRSSDKKSGNQYKVKIYRRSGVPALFSTCHFKIISAENLPTFVRTLSLIADQFAQIWHSNGNYSSNWSHRMRMFNGLRDKVVKHNTDLMKKAQEMKSEGLNNGNNNQNNSGGGGGGDIFEQLEEEGANERNNASTTSNGESERKNSEASVGLSRSNTTGRKKGNTGAINPNVLEFPETDDNVIYKNLEFNSFTR